MKKFFNIIPGEDACCILLYGDIGDYDGNVRSGDIARELLEAEALSGRIDVRINSNGGEVYAGIAIFNALKTARLTSPFTWTASLPAWPPSLPFAASRCR